MIPSMLKLDKHSKSVDIPIFNIVVYYSIVNYHICYFNTRKYKILYII